MSMDRNKRRLMTKRALAERLTGLAPEDRSRAVSSILLSAYGEDVLAVVELCLEGARRAAVEGMIDSEGDEELKLQRAKAKVVDELCGTLFTEPYEMIREDEVYREFASGDDPHAAFLAKEED